MIGRIFKAIFSTFLKDGGSNLRFNNTLICITVCICTILLCLVICNLLYLHFIDVTTAIITFGGYLTTLITIAYGSKLIQKNIEEKPNS